MHFALRACALPVSPISLVPEEANPCSGIRIVLNKIELAIGEPLDALTGVVASDLSVSNYPLPDEYGFMSHEFGHVAGSTCPSHVRKGSD